MVRRRTVFSVCLFSLFFNGLANDAAPALAETVLLNFSSTNCGPCRRMRAVINRLAAAGHRIRGIDFNRDRQIAAQYQVDQVPTFIVLSDGREVARSEGITSYEQLTRMMTVAKPTPPRQRAMPMGQSPRTFATQDAANAAPRASSNNLSTPQEGRIVAIQEPSSSRQPATASVATPFDQPIARQTPAAAGSPDAQGRLIEATVKVSVKDPDGTSAGTGTIVDARSGEALILTCGHLFRSSAGKGPITVTMFRPGPAGAEINGTTAGRLVDYDLERDLALVSFRAQQPVRSARIAPPGTSLTPGAAVTTVGCNNGQNATALSSQITAVNRYQGAPNVEVAGAPVEGRSGGGLFNAAGELIGVCFAADPESNEGLYTSLPSVIEKLDSLGLSMVYQSPAVSNSPSQSSLAIAAPAPSASEPDFSVRGQDHIAPPMETAVAVAPSPNVTSATDSLTTSLTPAEQAALEEIQKRGVDSEVICIIRPRSPEGKSDVITLTNASPAFVEALSQQASSSSSGGAAQYTR